MIDSVGLGFFLGFLLCWIVALTLVVNVDQNFEYHQNRNNRFIELCEGLNSTPKSFDVNELTCKNGLTVKYRDWVN